MKHSCLTPAAALAVLCLLFAGVASLSAQTPVALPTTMTTVAGGLVTGVVSGSLCPGSTTVKAANAYGDNCAAVAAALSTSSYGGIAADAYGNLFVNDDGNKAVHMIDPNTGIMTLVAGGGNTACSTKTTTAGDNCLAASNTTFSASSPHGLGIDPYGNVLISGYGDGLLHLVCRAASPLCTSAQIGYMRFVAGCYSGTKTPGAGSDAVQAAQIISGTCAAKNGQVDDAEGLTADLYGNIYWADSSSGRYRVVAGPQTSPYFSGNNPLYALLGNFAGYGTITQGYAYSVVNLNGTLSTAQGTALQTLGSDCTFKYAANSTTYSATNAPTDAYGDGCPFQYSSTAFGATVLQLGLAVDAAGNMVFVDPTHGLRVFFVQGWTNASAASAAGATGSVAAAGVAMYNAIAANNSGVTPTAGYVYLLAGGGSTNTLGTKPFLGTSLALADSTMNKVTVSPRGNIYIGDSSKVLFYDMYTGAIRILLASGTAPSATGGACNGAVARSKFGDGCPVSGSSASSYAKFGNGSALGVAVDAQGNLYLDDTVSNSGGMLVRKVLAQGMGTQPSATLAALGTSTTAYPLQALGAAQTQIYTAHFPVAAAASVTLTNSTSTGRNYGTPSCGSAVNADGSLECSVPVTYTPAAAGSQAATLTLTAAGGESETLNQGTTVTGSVLAVDAASTAGVPVLTSNALLSGNTPSAIAVDGAGNVYEATGTSIVESLGGSPASTVTLVAGLSAMPTALAVDQTGNLFYLNGSSTIQELAVSTAGGSATYNPASIAYTPANLGTANPVALAVDQAGNLLVADEQSSVTTLYKLSLAALAANTQSGCSYAFTSNGVLPTLCQSTISTVSSSALSALTFGAVSSLAVDPAGAIYVADTTSSAVYKLTPGVTSGLYAYAESTRESGISANALAVDAAGDLYVQNSAGVTMYTLSGATGVPVAGAVTNPAGVAVDGLGNIYSADAGTTVVSQVVRDALTANFGSSYTTEFAAALTNVGSQTGAAQNLANGAEAGDFNLAAGSGNGCVFSSNLLNAMLVGQSCTLTATFPAIGATTETDLIAFTPTAPATTTGGQLTLTGVADQKGYATTATIGAASTSSPTYSPGTEVSFPITVTASSTATDGSANTLGNPTSSNYVNISVDGGAAVTYNFTGTSGSFAATVTLNLAGLTAATHSFSVSFPQQGSFLSSSATSGSFTIGTSTTAVTWSPGAATQQVSAALGTGALDAVVATTGPAGNVGYTATCTSSAYVAGDPLTVCAGYSNTPVDASTYLPIGTYTLTATFYPTDTTDYTNSPAVVLNGYTVTQAGTMAAVGATTNLVAADGTGNYTSLTAALQALPITGGTIYIAPGTYTGQNAISYPNVQLRGLGGDPTKVILSGDNGAWPTGQFTAGTVPSGFSFGPVGKGGDEGSAVLDVSKSAFMGTAATAGNATYTPNNFYLENLTIQNIFDTDASTTTLWTAPGNGSSTCTLGTTPNTLQYLYNNNQLCGAQALALYVNSDGAILNNVNLLSQQDTLYASGIGCGTYCTVAREYMWKGLITGDVDYTFGDAALVFDHTNFFTTWHGLTATGQETITAQNKRFPTGTTSATDSSNATSSDYLSGFICNGCTLMSQSTGMNSLYYGRPYDISTSSYASSYSTWVMLNSQVDQVNPKGWIGWDGASEYLSTSTYAEFNTQAYIDPALCTAASSSTCTDYPYPSMLFNTTYPSLQYTFSSAAPSDAAAEPAGGNSGAGVTGTREPSAISLTAGTAVPYYPVNFLSTLVPSTKLSTGMPSTWNPIAAMAAEVNAFVPVASVPAIPYGGSVTLLGRPQTPGAGVIPSGSYAFYDSPGTSQVCTSATNGCTMLASGSLDGSGEAYLTISTLASGSHAITMVYGGDSNFAGSTSPVYGVYVLTPEQAATTTTLAVNNTSSTTGTTVAGTVTVAPSTAPGTITLTLDGAAATSCTLVNGSCSWSLNGLSNGLHSLLASYAGNSSFGPSQSANVTLSVVPPIATGDPRPVIEPSFPGVCQQLNAALTTDITTQDLDASVDVMTSNIDGARIQAALNSCSAMAVTAGTNLAVELSTDSTGALNAFLSGPLSMPSNVTLLVDPNATLYFSRNAQDYDIVSGTHTCGTINGNSATQSCLPLIAIPGTSTNVGIMGYGKLNGRGGDALLNGFATSGYTAPSTYTWWSLSTQANGEGNQQNPRFIQMDTGASNVTLYKITLLNSPMFHVSTTGAVSNFTAWDVKIVTPTGARNTDGIDPANVVNATITKSWISDGDDNVAVSAPNSSPAQNISITNNHFYAGHGESIGSYTSGGVSNILWDGNMSAGNGFASSLQNGSAVNANGTFVNGSADGNSTAIRIKTANDRGGLVTNIQYSNSCFLDHKTDIQFTPYYSSGDSTSSFPSYTNILLQNLIFANDDASNGSVELTGEYNSNATGGAAVTNPLYATLDNVTFPAALSSLVNSTTPVESATVWGDGNFSGGTGQYADVTVGPGQVSSNFLTAFSAIAATSANNDVLTNNIALGSLDAPVCTFTYLAPELTGPTGTPQTVPYGSTATLDVILTPTVGGAAYPNGTVTLTDAATSNTFPATFNGSGDTLAVVIPASDLTIGAHTFSATAYSGDTNYTVPAAWQNFGAYTVTVVQATPTVTLTSNENPSNYGDSVTFTATVPSTATGTISILDGSNVLASGVPLTSGSATFALSTLNASAAGHSITAVYSGDANYTSATSAVLTQVVNPITPSITWTTSPAISYGTLLSATQLDATLSVAGNCVYTPAAGTVLTAGTQTLSVLCTPMDSIDYTTASASVLLTVNKATASVALGNLSQTYTGSPLAATATTTPVGLALSLTYNGASTLPVAAGSCNVAATVNDANYVGSATGVLTTAKAGTSVGFSANPSNPNLGQSDLLTATVSGAGQPGGTVVFTAGAATLCTATLNATGAGSCSFIPTTDNNLTVTAQYLGDANHLASSATQTLFVYDTAVRLQLSSTQLTYPGATNLTVCMASPTATGSVKIYDGATLLATLSVQGGGCAYWYISPGLSAGGHTLTAVYSGDKNNAAGTSDPVVVNVSPVAVNLSAACWNATFAYGANYQCTVNVSSNAGAALGSITYVLDSNAAVAVPLSYGSAQFTLSEPIAGKHTVAIGYAQQTNFAAAAPQTETFTVTAAPVLVSLTPSTWYTYAGNSITFQAAITSWSAGAPNDNGQVSFYDGSKLLSTVPVNAGGVASYSTAGLAAASHTITASYAGGTNYASGSGSVTITIAP
jgi:sugar lactone lactonase YvrE